MEKEMSALAKMFVLPTFLIVLPHYRQCCKSLSGGCFIELLVTSYLYQ